MARRVSSVPLAACGARTRLGRARNSGSIAGSFQNTSSPAAAIRPSRSAASSAGSSTQDPREMLTKIAPGGSASIAARSISRSVAAPPAAAQSRISTSGASAAGVGTQR